MSLQTNIYDNQIYFGITFDNETQLILEPWKWNKITNHLIRDSNNMAFWSDFIEDKYGMLFTFTEGVNYTGGQLLKGGAQLLKDIYEKNGFPNGGSEAIVYFEIGYQVSNTLQLVNQWRINLNEYFCDFGGVSTSIEKLPFQAKFKSRGSAPCTVNSYSTMDGELLTPISTVQLRLHSKTLLETTEAQSVNPINTNEYRDNGSNAFVILIQPDLSNQPVSELQETFSQQAGLINTGIFTSPALTADIFTKGICQYTALTSGTLSKIIYSGSCHIWEWANDNPLGTSPSTIGLVWFKITPRVVQQRMIGGVLTIVGSPILGTPFIFDATTPGVAIGDPPPGSFPPLTNSGDRAQCNNAPYSWNHTFTNIYVQQGDNIYIQLMIEPIGMQVISPLDFNGVLFYLQNYENFVELEQLTTTPLTTCSAYRIFDVLTQMLENITGQKNALISPFFEKGGFGYKYVLANGYSIRNFGANIYELKKDTIGLINDLMSVYCLGAGIKKINNVEYLVIDYLPNFFRNRTILTLDETFVWKDKHSSKYCFNKIELGYTKHEGLNIIQQDEFCTEGSYLLQFLSIQDNLLTKKCGLITAGYLIEEQRRNQFLANPGHSLQNDNDIFLIATSEPCYFANNCNGYNVPYLVSIFSASTSSFGTNQTSLALLPGDRIQTNTGINSGTIFTIVSQFPGYPIVGNDIYYITPAPLDEIVSSGYTITPPSPNQVFSERNQPFEICSGVIDPTTIYNGRLSLKHILYNWRPLLGVGLFFVDLESEDLSVTQIVTTLVKMNSMFTSKFLESEEFKGNVGNLTTVEFNREFVRNYLANGENIFSPTGAEFKARIGWNDMNLIRKALSGETGDESVDYGGIVAKDDFGIYWFCHIMDIQYDLVKEIATFDVQKVRRVIP